MKLIITLCILLSASYAQSAVTVTCEGCTFTPVYTYLVTKSGEPVEEKVVELRDDNLAESHGLSMKMQADGTVSVGTISGTTSMEPIDPVEGLISSLRLIWIAEVNSRDTELSFKEWIIGKVGE